MKIKKRRPLHPGTILEEDYIKPLQLNLQELAAHIGITRNTLFKIRTGRAGITPAIALALAKTFDTTPQLWLNLQQKYDLWIAENEKTQVHISSIFKGKDLFPRYSTLRVRRRAVA